jgi:hypothetical protein
MGEAKRRRTSREIYEGLAPEERLGDGPVQEEYHAKMSAVAAAIDHFFNDGAKGDDRKIGYCLMVFPIGDDMTGRCNYMSNGISREDIVVLMKEMIARFQGQPEVRGTA